MIFKNYLNSVVLCLDARLKGYGEQDNPGDIGELSEHFIKEVLQEALAGVLKIFRGGKVIDHHGNKSKQIDLVVCSRNSLSLFSDKGLYPVETVYGVINIKKTLNHTNLFSDKPDVCGALKNLASIPTSEPKLIIPKLFDSTGMTDYFKNKFPYRVVFAYQGDIHASWENELNQMVADGTSISTLPDLIVVNKKGLLLKSMDGTFPFPDGRTENKWFHFIPIENHDQYYLPLPYILQALYEAAQYQYFILPSYVDYLNAEILDAPE